MEIRFLWKSWSVFSFHLKFHLKHRHEKRAKIRNETHSFCKILEIFEMIFSKNNQLNLFLSTFIYFRKMFWILDETEGRQLPDDFINLMRIKQYAVQSIESHIFRLRSMLKYASKLNWMICSISCISFTFVFLKDDEPLFMNPDSINHISHTFFSLPLSRPAFIN